LRGNGRTKPCRGGSEPNPRLSSAMSSWNKPIPKMTPPVCDSAGPHARNSVKTKIGRGGFEFLTADTNGATR
jgi:hypothetical protein